MSYPVKHALVSLALSLALFAVLLGVVLLAWPGLLTTGVGIVVSFGSGTACALAGVVCAHLIIEASERHGAAHPDSSEEEE